MAHITTESHGDVHVQVLPPESMLMSMALAVAKDHVEVHDPWSMLLLTIKGKEVSSVLVLMTIDSPVRTNYVEGFCDIFPKSLTPQLEIVWSESHWWELFKILMQKCRFSKLMASGLGKGEDSVFFMAACSLRV